MVFDEAGKITSMRAYWSFDAMRPATAEDQAELVVDIREPPGAFGVAEVLGGASCDAQDRLSCAVG